jgi:hypothetical protein
MLKASPLKHILLLACILSIIAFSAKPAQCGYANTIVVAKSGGDHNNLNSAVTAAKALNPSKTNPVLIKIMPGQYLHSSLIELPPYVDIEGSGVNMTVIRFDQAFGGSKAMQASGSLGATREIRNFTLEVLGLPDGVTCTLCGTQVGVYVTNGASLSIRDVNIVPFYGNNMTMGVMIDTATGETTLQDVTISFVTTGLEVRSGGKARLTRTKILRAGSQALVSSNPSESGWIIMHGCELSVNNPAAGNAIAASGSTTIYVVDSSIINGFVRFSVNSSAVMLNSLVGTLPMQFDSTASSQCRNLYDVNLNDVTCP